MLILFCTFLFVIIICCVDAGMLSGSTVASSFGKLVGKKNPREGVKQEDLAIALLMMLTNNIGQVAHLNAQLHSCSKIYFLGNFLRQNAISCRRLAFAIDFWSKGEKEAIFLVHEGYFGALGTFLMSAFGSDVDVIIAGSAGDGGGGNRKKEGPGRRKSLSGLFSEMDKKSESSSRGRGGRHRSSSLDGTTSSSMNVTSSRSDRLYDGDNKFGKFISKGFQSLRNMSGGGAPVSVHTSNSIRTPISPRGRSNTISSDVESLHSEQSSVSGVGATVNNIPGIGITNARSAVVPRLSEQQQNQNQQSLATKEDGGIVFNDLSFSASSPSSRGRTVSDDYVVRTASLRNKNPRYQQEAPKFNESEEDGEEGDFFLGDTADSTPRS